MQQVFVSDAKRFLDLNMVTGRYSAALIREFDRHVENRTANIFQIFNEIGALEGVNGAKPSRTKAASMFRGKRLAGLWHKHYPQAQFMPANLKNHWNPKRLRSLVMASFGGRPFFDEQAAKELSYKYVVEGYKERSSKGNLTGEWVVFAKQDDVNYYLTLGTHNEDDETIWRRCSGCAAEFPELRIFQDGH